MSDFLFGPILKTEGGEASLDPSMTVEEAKRLDEQAYQARFKPITTIKAGELVAFTTGEYSDYSKPHISFHKGWWYVSKGTAYLEAHEIWVLTELWPMLDCEGFVIE